MNADRLTEETPRDAATLAADALIALPDLSSIETTAAGFSGTVYEPVTAADRVALKCAADLAWQTARLVRIVAELAQRVDAIEEPDPRDDALDLIAAALNEPDRVGWDVGIMETIQAIIIGTGRPCVDVVTAWENLNDDTPHAVTLDMCNPDTLDEVLARYPRVTAQHVAPALHHGFPAFRFVGPRADLVAMIRSDWDDGSSDPTDGLNIEPVAP